VHETTKGNTNMRHLDIYARRDPQLAPFLLREVDIEYKRRCRKVNFVFWMTAFVATMLFQARESLETAFYMKHYTELLREELDSKDDDMDLRRAKIVQLLKLVKDAEGRARAAGEALAAEKAPATDARYKASAWTEKDTEAAVAILQSAEIPEAHRRLSKGAKPNSELDLTGTRGNDALFAVKK
jgi:hypothetical protein